MKLRSGSNFTSILLSSNNVTFNLLQLKLLSWKRHRQEDSSRHRYWGFSVQKVLLLLDIVDLFTRQCGQFIKDIVHCSNSAHSPGLLLFVSNCIGLRDLRLNGGVWINRRGLLGNILWGGFTNGDSLAL